MTPSANRDAISAQQQPTHQAPFFAPIRSAPGPAAAPGAEQEAERAAAFPEADVLERRQLIDGRDEERRAGDPPARAIPGEHVAGDRAPGKPDRERERPDRSPREEIARREEERRKRRALSGHARIERDRRRDRREHHRGHHHDPDAEEPAQRSETGPRAVVHAPHLVERPPPADAGEGEKPSDEPEPGARGRKGRSKTCAAGAVIVCVRGADHGLKRPRRTRTSRDRSCPRTRCRRR